jgi:hypothetical protein
MKIRISRFAWAVAAAAVAGGWAVAAAEAPLAFTIEGSRGALTQFRSGTMTLPLRPGGGFSVTDFTAKREVGFSRTSVQPQAAGFVFSADNGDLSLRANFTPGNDGVEVSGEIARRGEGQRALIVRYVVPVATDGAVFSNHLSQSAAISAETRELGTIIPIAAIAGKDWGAALAIPPDFPCCFGLTGSAEGLGIEFYLGLSPDVKALPNRATFRFMIDRAQPGWGFRSALARYYERHADYYRPRYQGAGFWNWNDPGALDDPQHIAGAALPLWKAHGLTKGALYAKQVELDRKYGVVSFAYTIVGMRELTGLPELPADYEGAMKVLREFEQAWKAEGADGPMHQKHASNSERNRELLSQILSSTVQEADGRMRLRLRNTVWGASSVTFIMNPNPDLFNDRTPAVPTVGSVTKQMLTEWFADPEVPGVHMDSLGAQWPSCVNYSTEQWRYTRYPLTFDKEGRVAMHNMVSHFEFLEDVRALALKHKKLLFGNGIDIYSSRNLTEHYNGLHNGRFFLSATLDMAGREITDDHMSRERMEAVRVCMGPKLMTALLYKWKDPEVVKQQMNRALAYDIFASPNRFFEDKISYLAAPDGFARDRELLTWFAKHARTLHAAGWQPVTHARADSRDIACERYGRGDVVYFALVNLGEAPADATLTVDMAALSMAPGDGASSSFSEVARGATIRATTDGDTGKVRLRLNPNETQILKLTRTW